MSLALSPRMEIAVPRLRVWLVFVAGLFVSLSLSAQETSAKTPREIVAEACVLMDVDQQKALVEGLGTASADEVVPLLAKWKEGEIFQYQDAAGNNLAVLLDGEADGDEKFALVALADGKPVTAEDGKPVRMSKDDLYMADTDSSLRRVMKGVTDRLALSSPDVAKRMRAVQDTGLEQDLAKLPLLEQLATTEKSSKVKHALAEAMAMVKLRSEDMAVREAAVKELGSMGSIASQGSIKTIRDDAEKAGQVSLVAACTKAQADIDSHVTFVNSAGTVFRGLSKGSILLIAAIGLAITFGLMGVINMAHGELIVVGAYTTYMVQNIFAKWNLSGFAGDAYFLVAIPASFLSAALVGLILERGIIRFLYKRPLESLLATWGVSMVMQQLFRLIFGANNVQVDSPGFLSGNWTVNDIVFGWNRVFVIGFAVLIIFLTWATLNKTSLGMLIRAVMQNRNMAACMGIRTERVNMMTFAFGSGLAGLAGAFLSQIGNVGPNLGQDYIVDSFMT
ncbi:MAG: urea ABC transporter permease subunit UrtB, partial [Verrucomicrobiaceae bacterium]